LQDRRIRYLAPKAWTPNKDDMQTLLNINQRRYEVPDVSQRKVKKAILPQKSLSRATEVLKLIHTGVGGPIQPASRGVTIFYYIHRRS